VSAYVLGIVLSVLIVLVWPALMLLAGVLDCSFFTIWMFLVWVLGTLSAIYLGLVPPIAEIVQVNFNVMRYINSLFTLLSFSYCTHSVHPTI